MTAAKLNPSQQAAVDCLDGPLLLLAGAGTGKTRVIIHRIAKLLQRGVPPEAVLAVTFTNKAAKEMRARVAGLLSDKLAERLTLSTFHAFCVQVLRRHANMLGYSRNFTIATEGYQKGLIREVATQLNLVREGCSPNLWLALISRAKTAMESPEDLRQKDIPHAADLARVYQQYQKRLQQMDLVDFDDLLGLTVRLWTEQPQILAQYQERYHYLMIDEYQDTNAVQLRLMLLLAGKRANICVVGDDDQSIYGWRGADLGNILEFESHFPAAQVIRLEQNYRSTNHILHAANALIGKNTKRRVKNLWSAGGLGEKLLAVCCLDEHDEANFAAEYILSKASGAQWQRFAVLVRAGHQTRALEETFRKRRVPYVLVGANSFYQRKEILDVISFLQLIQNPRDNLALLRIINVPPRGAGEVTVDKLRELGQLSGMPLSELLNHDALQRAIPADSARNLREFQQLLAAARRDFAAPGELFAKTERLLKSLRYIEGLVQMYKPREDALQRRDNVLEFLASMAEFDQRHPAGKLGDYLELFALQDANDRREKDRKNGDNAVTLMTVHAAKGLEYPTVLVVGMEQGLFPNQMALDEGNEEEERRLCYVAITRAKQELVLTYAERRRVMNRVVPKRPSKFLDELPAEDIVFTTPKLAIAPASDSDIKKYLALMRAQFNTPEET
jgi:DNA helicase-2/ATP-dependent DNA helicase PcrA